MHPGIPEQDFTIRGYSGLGVSKASLALTGSEVEVDLYTVLADKFEMAA